MQIGSRVIINHFFYKQPLQSYIVALNEKTLILKLTKDLENFKILDGDPIVLYYHTPTMTQSMECSVQNIDFCKRQLVIIIINSEQISNRRLNGRVLVSLYAIVQWDHTQSNIIIRDLSVGGIGFYAKQLFDIGQRLTVFTRIDSEDVVLVVEVKWLRKNQLYFNYGAQFVLLDNRSQELIDKFITFLKKGLEELGN